MLVVMQHGDVFFAPNEIKNIVAVYC